MRAYAEPLGITIAVLDMEQTFREELELRRRRSPAAPHSSCNPAKS